MSNTFGVKLRQRTKVSDEARRRRSNMADTGARDWHSSDVFSRLKQYKR